MSVVDDATLLKMAEAEILGEAKKAAIRHSISGISGWQPCPKPNKIFLTNTILQAMASNKVLARKKDSKHIKPERKLLQKKSKLDMTTNFIYQKPNKAKEKARDGSKTSKQKISTIRLGDEHSKKKNKKTKDKCNVKKIKLKKT